MTVFVQQHSETNADVDALELSGQNERAFFGRRSNYLCNLPRKKTRSEDYTSQPTVHRTPCG